MLTTIHGFSSERIVPVFEKYNGTGYYVAISEADRHERLDYLATIHHGIDMTRVRARARARAATCSTSAGSTPTRERSRRSRWPSEPGCPLILAGIIQDQEYFERLVAPRIDGERVT